MHEGVWCVVCSVCIIYFIVVYVCSVVCECIDIRVRWLVELWLWSGVYLIYRGYMSNMYV